MSRIVLVPAPTGDGRIVLRAVVETRAEAARRWLERLRPRRGSRDPRDPRASARRHQSGMRTTRPSFVAPRSAT